MLLKELTNGLIHLLYPRLCEGCRQQLVAGEEVLCLSCGHELPKTGSHHVADNEAAMRFAGRIPFAHATSFAYFTDDGLLQHLLHGLKYKGKKDIGRYLGRQFGYDLRATDWISSVDMIIPVPLHIKKERVRGYNQSALVAAGMSSVLNIPANEGLLLRKRHTESQTSKTRSQRADNMKDAFEISDANALEHKHVLLIDDVLTTGATLEACAIALMQVSHIKITICSVGLAQ